MVPTPSKTKRFLKYAGGVTALVVIPTILANFSGSRIEDGYKAFLRKKPSQQPAPPPPSPTTISVSKPPVPPVVADHLVQINIYGGQPKIIDGRAPSTTEHPDATKNGNGEAKSVSGPLTRGSSDENPARSQSKGTSVGTDEAVKSDPVRSYGTPDHIATAIGDVVPTEQSTQSPISISELSSLNEGEYYVHPGRYLVGGEPRTIDRGMKLKVERGGTIRMYWSDPVRGGFGTFEFVTRSRMSGVQSALAQPQNPLLYSANNSPNLRIANPISLVPGATMSRPLVSSDQTPVTVETGVVNGIYYRSHSYDTNHP